LGADVLKLTLKKQARFVHTKIRHSRASYQVSAVRVNEGPFSSTIARPASQW
jgi:hypothetical protein